MSNRNTMCPKCGRRGRAPLMAGPRCGADAYPTVCPDDGTRMLVEGELGWTGAPPKNRKPAVAPDGRIRRFS